MLIPFNAIQIEKFNLFFDEIKKKKKWNSYVI